MAQTVSAALQKHAPQKVTALSLASQHLLDMYPLILWTSSSSQEPTGDSGQVFHTVW